LRTWPPAQAKNTVAHLKTFAEEVWCTWLHCAAQTTLAAAVKIATRPYVLSFRHGLHLPIWSTIPSWQDWFMLLLEHFGESWLDHPMCTPVADDDVRASYPSAVQKSTAAKIDAYVWQRRRPALLVWWLRHPWHHHVLHKKTLGTWYAKRYHFVIRTALSQPTAGYSRDVVVLTHGDGTYPALTTREMATNTGAHALFQRQLPQQSSIYALRERQAWTVTPVVGTYSSNACFIQRQAALMLPPREQTAHPAFWSLWCFHDAMADIFEGWLLRSRRSSMSVFGSHTRLARKCYHREQWRLARTVLAKRYTLPPMATCAWPESVERFIEEMEGNEYYTTHMVHHVLPAPPAVA
jgi:hypothetical protein